jgi:type IV pilus assembly protein PilB
MKAPVEAARLPKTSLEAPVRTLGTRAMLGAILVRRGLVTAEQLEQALHDKESSGRRLGEIVVDHGWVTGADLASVLAEQHELECLDLVREEIDAAATSLLPERLARRYRALPVRFLDEESVLVAVDDPTNVITSDDLRLALGLNVRFAVVPPDDLASTIDRVYRSQLSAHEGSIDEMIEDEPAVEDIRDGAATSAPAIKLVNSLIGLAIDQQASDLHFQPGHDGIDVRARIDGVMRKLTTITPDLQPAVTSRLKIMGELDIAERRAPQDGRVSIRFGGQPMDLRIAVLPTTYGEQIVLRILYRSGSRRGVTELGMSAADETAFMRAIRQPYGAVVTVGPTGSGKTTTLYAALDFLNDAERVVATIEDPVEHQIPGVTQVEVNVKSGLTFARGLRTMLRSDPDILLVGEIRDDETARIAIQAAMTGHLVLTSLHAQDAASSIARLKEMGVESGLLATSVNCIVAQRLARRLCPECREPYWPEAEDRDLVGATEEEVEDFWLYKPKGCVECAGNGYAGRVALYEVLPVTSRIRSLIESPTEEIFRAAVEEGMTTMRQDGVRLCRLGVTSTDEVRRVTGDHGA